MNKRVPISILGFAIAIATFAINSAAQLPTPTPFNSGKPQSINELFDFGITGPSGAQSSPVPTVQQPLPGHVRAKRPGAIRVGLVSKDSKAPADQVRASLSRMSEMLSGGDASGGYDSVLLDQKLDRNILEEARSKQCDYILVLDTVSTLKGMDESKKSGGFLSGIVKDIIEVAKDLPGVKSGTVSKTAGAASSASASVDRVEGLLSKISQATKRGDRVTISYSLESVGGAMVLPKTSEKITANQNGEPILDSILVSIGNKILNAIPEPTMRTVTVAEPVVGQPAIVRPPSSVPPSSGSGATNGSMVNAPGSIVSSAAQSGRNYVTGNLKEEGGHAYVTGGDLTSRARHTVKPQLPASLTKAVYTSTVQITVDESGNVIAAAPLDGNGSFRASAAQAARQWKFAPFLASGVPVRVRGTITIVYAPY